MALVLDAGGRVAVDRLDRSTGAMLRVAHHETLPVRTGAAVVAPVWRNGSRRANLACMLTGVETVPLGGATGRSIGEVQARNRTGDVVDGHLGSIVRSGDTVLTSDVTGIETILEAQGVDAATVLAV